MRAAAKDFDDAVEGSVARISAFAPWAAEIMSPSGVHLYMCSATMAGVGLAQGSPQTKANCHSRHLVIHPTRPKTEMGKALSHALDSLVAAARRDKHRTWHPKNQPRVYGRSLGRMVCTKLSADLRLFLEGQDWCGSGSTQKELHQLQHMEWRLSLTEPGG